jgi:hypothetical protein
VFEADVLTEVTLYINGKHDTGLALGVPLIAARGNVYIGKNPWNEGFFGELADVFWHCGSLMTDEIVDIFET